MKLRPSANSGVKASMLQVYHNYEQLFGRGQLRRNILVIFSNHYKVILLNMHNINNVLISHLFLVSLLSPCYRNRNRCIFVIVLVVHTVYV